MRFLRFLLRQRNNQNQGSAVAFVLMIGLLMLGAGAAMLTQSQAQQNAVIDLLETSQIKNASDAVIARLKLDFSNPTLAYFLRFEQKNWKNHIEDYEARLCRSDEEYNPIAQKVWTLGEQEKMDIEDFKYFLSDLTRVSDRQAIITATVENGDKGSSTIQADLSWKFSYLDSNTPVPSFFSEKNTSKRLQFQGNVWIFDPECSSKLKVYEPYNLKYVPFTIPQLPNINNIKLRLPSFNQLTLDNSYEEKEIRFPRPEDNPTRKENGYQYYEYILTDIEDKSIHIETNRNTIVMLHLEGDASKTKITHTCEGTTDCPAQNLIILGHGNSKFCFVFDELNASIFVPEGEVGIKPETRYKLANATGTVWTKKLDTTGVCGNDKIIFYESLAFKNIPEELQIPSIYPKIEIDFKGRTETINAQKKEPYTEPDFVSPEQGMPISIEPQ